MTRLTPEERRLSRGPGALGKPRALPKKLYHRGPPVYWGEIGWVWDWERYSVGDPEEAANCCDGNMYWDACSTLTRPPHTAQTCPFLHGNLLARMAPHDLETIRRSGICFRCGILTFSVHAAAPNCPHHLAFGKVPPDLVRYMVSKTPPYIIRDGVPWLVCTVHFYSLSHPGPRYWRMHLLEDEYHKALEF